MTDRAAFLRRIIAAPADDLPRLVFADWLDEHGEGERAEFVRVQCQIATLERFAPSSIRNTDEGREQYAALRRRERELLLRHWAAWTPYLSPGNSLQVILSDRWQFDGTPAGLFTRGFVSSVTCTWADWSAHAGAIRAATPLERVRLTTMPTDEWRRDPSSLDGGPLQALVSLDGHNRQVGVVECTRTGGCVGSRPVDNSRIILDLLSAEYPSIEFNLPPFAARQYVLDGVTLNMADYMLRVEERFADAVGSNYASGLAASDRFHSTHALR